VKGKKEGIENIGLFVKKSTGKLVGRGRVFLVESEASELAFQKRRKAMYRKDTISTNLRSAQRR